MHHDIKQWCQECKRCQIAKNTQPAAGAYLGYLLASRPNRILAVFTLLEPSKNGMENVLVMTDVFSNYTQAVPTHDQRASTVAKVLVNESIFWGFKVVSIRTEAETLKATSFNSSAVFMALRKAAPLLHCQCFIPATPALAYLVIFV